jgi:hypothetical protein
MIGKAALAIKQINNLIEELQNTKNPEIDAKKTQINAISKTIQQIERSGVQVPEDLLIIQNKLKTELNQFDNPDDILLFIADELSKSVRKIRDPYNKTSDANIRKNTFKGRISRDIPTIKRPELQRIIIETLKEFGGRANANDVLDKLAIKLKNKLTPADLELLDDGYTRWQKNVHWTRYILTGKGVLKNNSPRGIWELADYKK